MEKPEPPAPGPMSMIKIDGARIKALREQQGLTQLYLATAVQVTTDTISRWENRRYPSIKHENGIKLAEALGVPLEELLLQAPPEQPPDKSQPSVTPPDPAPTAAGKPIPGKILSSKFHRKVIIAGVALTIMIALLGIIFFKGLPNTTLQTTAQRTVPPQCPAEIPCPILIEITTDQHNPSAIIVTENLGEGLTPLSTSPPIVAQGGAGKSLKWLLKIQGKKRLAYTVTLSGETVTHGSVSGTITSKSQDTTTPQIIQGKNAIPIAPFHWADADRDHHISDSEILTVYDLYNELPGLQLDIDMVEEIWLAGGYRYSEQEKTFHPVDRFQDPTIEEAH